MDQEFGRNTSQSGTESAAPGQRTRKMLHRAGKEANARTSHQMHQLSDRIRAAAEDLRSMAAQGGDASPVPATARKLSDYTNRSADWLDSKDAATMVREVGDFARRFPGRFLAAALVGGILVGRLSRGAVAAQHSNGTGRNEGRNEGMHKDERWFDASSSDRGTSFTSASSSAPLATAGEDL